MVIFHISICLWARGQTLHSSRIAASVEIGLNIPLLGSKTVSQKLQGIGVNPYNYVGVKTSVMFPTLFSTKPLSQSWLPGQLHWNSLMSWSTLTRPRRTPTVPRFLRTLPVNVWLPRPPAESKQWHLVQLVATELQYENVRTLLKTCQITHGYHMLLYNVDDRIVYGCLGVSPWWAWVISHPLAQAEWQGMMVWFWASCPVPWLQRYR